MHARMTEQASAMLSIEMSSFIYLNTSVMSCALERQEAGDLFIFVTTSCVYTMTH